MFNIKKSAVLLLVPYFMMSQVHAAAWIEKLQQKWNALGKFDEKNFETYPTVQDYFAAKFRKTRTITMNNVSYGAGTIMYERAKTYCDHDGGNFTQLKPHPTPLVPYRGAEILRTPNLQGYYGLFACEGIPHSWKVYFDHQNERIFEYPSPNTASDVSYSFE